jgi:uncharacterized protein
MNTPYYLYHEGNRELQDRFDSRRIADRLEETRVYTRFTEIDREIIERAPFFFLATADRAGRPDCSYKGGIPGFVRVEGDDLLAFPHYDGNGMFKSLGNVLINPEVGMLFLEFSGQQRRLRVNGTASVHQDDPLLETMPGSQLIVRVKARHIFPNCPRYIHQMELVKESVYAPRPGHQPPDPLWKSKPDLKDYLPSPEKPNCQSKNRLLCSTHEKDEKQRD